MRLFFVYVTSLIVLSGCANTERATDITLANPVSNTAALSRSAETTRASANLQSNTSAETVMPGAGLSTGYGGVVQMGSEPANPPSTLKAPAQAQASPVKSEAIASSESTDLTESKIAARVISITRTRPDCTGSECPVIKIKRLSFAGRERFNAFLDQTLASMAQVDSTHTVAYKSLAEFATYFWKVAKPGYEIVLEASIKRSDESLVVVQLDSYIFTGGAHGISTTQYINWLPEVDKILSLESMLLPKMMPAFEKALRQQHSLWLKTNPQAMENPSAYNKLWPFVPTDNAALMADGLAVTYDPYSIAPYAFGRPTLTIPYSQLKGILRPEVMPK